jgi:hypothetical protein
LYDISQALSVAAKVQSSVSATEELETVAEEPGTLTDELEFTFETLEELVPDGLDSREAPPTLEEDT